MNPPESLLIKDRYRLGHRIGAGGMGTVYQGLDIETDSPVAIKLLNSHEMLGNPGILERFRREGEALRDLNHPNIVKMLDAVEQEGGHFLIMEFIEGGDLSRKLEKEKPLPINTILQIAIELADALTRAHYLKIIHRDLKPSNVLLAADGTPRLTDFGVAFVASKERLTAKHQTFGTADYLSPEALLGEQPGEQHDIWSFGVMLFELVTDERPFKGPTITRLLMSIMSDTPPDIEQLRTDCPVALADLIYRMLEKDVNTRIHTIRQVGLELEDIIRGHSVSTLQLPTRFDTPAAPLSAWLKHNIPVPTTPFIGRKTELIELTRLIHHPDNRLITIVGLGGTGKTRIALEIAHRQLPYFTDGVYLIELASLNTVPDVIVAIADAVNYLYRQDGRSLNEQLIDYLRNKHILLVFDNFEHLLDATSAVNNILTTAPHIQILTTSRESLGLQEEVIFRIEGMEYREWKQPEDIREYGATLLFLQSARHVQPDYDLSDSELPFVAQICELTQALPLALLLAAAWLNTLSLPEIVQSLRENIDFLETTARNIPARHRSIRAVFDSTWVLLKDDERDIFMKLSVFQGTFSRDAVQTVTRASLRQLSVLVNKSLLQRDPRHGRYGFHPLLRQYAHEKLQSDTTAHDRHCAYYAAFLRRMSLQASRTLKKETLDAIALEYDNIRKGWEWALLNDRVAELPDYIRMMWHFFEARNRFEEAEQLYHDAAEYPSPLRGQILTGYGWFTYRIGHVDEGAQILEQSIATIREQGDDTGFTLTLLGLVSNARGNYDHARAYCEEALTIARQRNDLWSENICLNVLCNIARRQGDYQAARRLCEDGLSLARLRSDDVGVAIALNNLGEIAFNIGDYETALEHCEESLLLSRSIDDHIGMAISQDRLGKIFFTLGHYEKAAQLFQQSLERSRSINDRLGVSISMNYLALVASITGDYDHAIQTAHESYRISSELANPRNIIFTLTTLGSVCYRKGDFSQAFAYYTRAMHEAEQSHNRYDMTTLHTRLGETAIELHDVTTAKIHLRAALTSLRKTPTLTTPLIEFLFACRSLLSPTQPQLAASISRLIQDSPITPHYIRHDMQPENIPSDAIELDTLLEQLDFAL